MKKECQDCGADINVPDDALVGEIVTCPDCGAEFEISSKTQHTVDLKPAESVGEDWGQ
jgi:alpha-aminoadipate/glutamate carrier protein LysW